MFGYIVPNQAEKKVFQISEQRAVAKGHNSPFSATELLKEHDEVYLSGFDFIRLASNVVVIARHSKVGKTIYGSSAAKYFAVDTKVPYLF